MADHLAPWKYATARLACACIPWNSTKISLPVDVRSKSSALRMPSANFLTCRGRAMLMTPVAAAPNLSSHLVPPVKFRGRRRRRCGAAVCKMGQPQQQAYVAQAPPTAPQPSKPAGHVHMLFMGLVIVMQAFALAGATVTGVLARKRRQEMELLNSKLRTINAELRRQREEEAREEASLSKDGSSGSGSPEQEEPPGIDIAAYRSALERTLGAPAAAHPVEAYGDGKLSLAAARRRISATIKEVKQQLRDAAPGVGEPLQSAAGPLLASAMELAEGIQDLKAQRALVRLRAAMLRKAGVLEGALAELQRSIALSLELGESSGDANVLGEIGDVLTEMGDFERAGEYYDRCIRAIQDEVPPSLSSTWDMQ